MRLILKFMLMTSLTALVACSGGGKSSKGPDEFSVVPTKPLSMPADFTSLPTPNVGAANRVDQNPNQDAVAALGGNASALDRSGVRGSETALLNAATRYGIAGDIRQTLEVEDAELRRKNGARVLERLAGQKITERTYRSQRLNNQQELVRLRARGVRTPTAPPP